MRYLGIDYGSKRIGIALSDEGGTIAFPKGVIENDQRALSTLLELVTAERIGAIVVGDTRSFSHLENPVTAEAEQFAEKLRAKAGVPVERAWEAGSSVEASRYAPEKGGHDDSAAAAIILQRFLEMKK